MKMGWWIQSGWVAVGLWLTCLPVWSQHAGRKETLGDYGVAVDVYVSLPTQAPLGGLILVHDVGGVRDEVLRSADRLAVAGYVAVAVDLYDGKTPTNPEEAQKLQDRINPPWGLRVMRSAARFLREDPSVCVPRIGVVGWGIGGAWALRFSSEDPAIGACAILDAPLPDNGEILTNLRAPLLLVVALKNASVPASRVATFRDILKARNHYAEIVRYKAPAAFMITDHPNYNGDQARDVQTRLLAFMQKYLVEAPVSPPVFQSPTP